MIRLLKHVWWVLTKGYTCDDCGTYSRRWRGKAHVQVKGAALAPTVFLRCPECANKWAMLRIETIVRDTLPAFEALVMLGTGGADAAA